MSEHPLSCPAHADAALVLADGTVFFGRGLGAKGQTVLGELCFNTAMTGYQEILTDPSYAGQIIVFTFPHIGNVGTNPEDVESQETGSARGLVLREAITEPSNFRHAEHFSQWLAEKGVTGISGVDTRALTRKIRLSGPQNCAIHFSPATGQINVASLQQQAQDWQDLNAFDLTGEVATKQQMLWNENLWQLGHGHGKAQKTSRKVVVVDYGVKHNILRHLTERGCEVVVVPPKTSARDILVLQPEGVFLSNGPGDPVTTSPLSTPMIRELMDKNIPIFGICLGHQLIGLALGGKTEKMKQGHRGANHPIRNLKTGLVEITSQNHGYVVAAGSLPANAEVTHVSLFDGTIAGLELTDKPVFAVQYHPESSPGPHDSRYLFDHFMELMEKTGVRSSEFRVHTHGS